MEKINSIPTPVPPLCPEMNDSSYKIIGNSHPSDRYSLLDLWVTHCSSSLSDECESIQTIYNTIDNMAFRIATVNKFYDHSNQNQPLREYLKVSDQYNYRNTIIWDMKMTLKPNEIRFTDGTTAIGYEENYLSAKNNDDDSNAMFKISFHFDPYYDIYEQYYQFSKHN